MDAPSCGGCSDLVDTGGAHVYRWSDFDAGWASYDDAKRVAVIYGMIHVQRALRRLTLNMRDRVVASSQNPSRHCGASVAISDDGSVVLLGCPGGVGYDYTTSTQYSNTGFVSIHSCVAALLV